jgi:arylsulfatase A-like enzyme
MTRSPWFVVTLLGALLPGCSGDERSPDPGAVPDGMERPLVRLWRDLAPVEHDQPALQSDAGSLWFASQFDGTQLFYRALPKEQGGLAYEEYWPAGGELRLTSEERWGVCAGGPMRGGEALSVRVRVRPDRKHKDAKELVLVAVIELTEPFDASVTLDQDDVAALLDSRRNASRIITGMVGADTLELRTDFVTDPGTQALVVYLLAPVDEPSRPLVYESLRVRRFSLSEYVAAGGVVRRMQRLDDANNPAAVRVQLDRDERTGLLAVAPSSFTWELPASAATRRLELSLGVMPRHAEMQGAVRFLVKAGEAVLLDVTRRAPGTPAEAAWDDRLIELPASPDSALRLTLSTEAVGDDPPLSFFGHPALCTDTGERRPNILLISLDTLRPDRLGCYGAEPSHSPHLDALAAQGLRFESAYSTSSYTLPSHGSLLTGQYPAFHGAVDVTDTLDPARSPLLADLFARAGYVTAGFTGGGYVSSEYGFAQGFDRYSHNDPVWAVDTLRGAMLLQTMSWERMPLSPELLRRYDVRSVTEWLSRRSDGVPFFLFLHTYIVHNYAPSEEFLRSHDLLGRAGDDSFERPFNHKDRERFNQGEEISLAAVQGQYLPYYDATISTADAFVGQVMAALAAAGLADDTMVVVTSDHGEEFGEHAFFGHGETLYDDNTRVPLIVRLPANQAGAAGQVLSDPVSLVDIAPWVLEVAGLQPDERMSVSPPLGPDHFSPPGRSLAFIELDNHRYRTSAVRSDELKLTVHIGQDGEDFETELFELFDLAADPDELHDLAAERPGDVARLRNRLRVFQDYAEALFPRDGSVFNPADLSPEQIENLKALGYLGDLELPDDD